MPTARQPEQPSAIPAIPVKRVFKTRHFQRWMKKTDLTDATFLAAVEEMRNGLIDADLGGGLYKKRVALPHRGKSGSTRTLIASNLDSLWFFLNGFEKNELDNITDTEEAVLKQSATDLLATTPQIIAAMLAEERLKEITP